jgi:histidinol phosphatase-like enzyme
VWFSCDSRRWHCDERKTHGRAYTSYLGKNGTTLTPVYVLGDRLVPYERKDLCDVSCKYERKFQQGYLARLYDFYYE